MVYAHQVEWAHTEETGWPELSPEQVREKERN
jgi:hypothetical protein